MGKENNDKKSNTPTPPAGEPNKGRGGRRGVRIVNDGTIIQLLDPLGNSKEKHQASNMIFSTIQGFMMLPTFIAPSST